MPDLPLDVRRNLHTALLDGYRDAEAINLVLKLHLDTNVGKLTSPNKELPSMMTAIITELESREQILQFAFACARERVKNSIVRRAWQEVFAAADKLKPAIQTKVFPDGLVVVSAADTEADRTRAALVTQRLQAAGIQAWMDGPLAEGMDLRIATLRSALGKAERLVLLVSPNQTGTPEIDPFQKAAFDFAKTRDNPACETIAVRLKNVQSTQLRLMGVVDPARELDLSVDDSESRVSDQLLALFVAGQSADTRASTTSKEKRPRIASEDTVIEKLRGMRQITFFVGPSHIVLGGAASLELVRDQVVRDLLADAGLAHTVRHDDLPPAFDMAGYLYALVNGDVNLETKVAMVLDARAGQAIAIQQPLAETVAVIGRRYPSFRQLIVTTNTDLMIERALLARGLSFERCVQVNVNAEFPTLRVSQFTPPAPLLQDWDEFIRASEREGRTLQVNPGSSHPSASTSSPTLATTHPPIRLYKFLGSIDRPGSCALTAPRHDEVLSNNAFKRGTPPEIAGFVQDSVVVLLGYSLLDPEFRLLRQTFLAVPTANDLRFLVYDPTNGRPPCGTLQLERAVEEQLQAQYRESPAKINFSRQEPSAFLTNLARKL